MPIAVPKPSMWAPGFNRDHPLARGCVLYLPLWEGGGGKVFDVAGRGINADGTLTNMEPASDWMPSPYGPCLDFDGTNDRVVVPALPPITTKLTIAALTWVSSFVNDVMWLEFSTNASSGDNGLAWYTTGGDFQVFSREGVTYVSANSTYPATPGWYHYCTTFDSTLATNEITIYRDGADATTSRPNNNNTSISHGSQPLYLGGRQNGTFSAAVRFAYVAVWNRILTTAEVRELYEQPWALIEQEDDWEMYAAATQGGGTPIPVFDQYYRRMRAA